MSQQENIHNSLEKSVFIVGLLIIGSVIGYLTYLTFQDRKRPPLLVVTSYYEPNMTDYSFQVTVENLGEETAANANIKMSLYQNGKIVETGILNINYIPIESSETGWIVFDRERQLTDSLVLSSMTFLKP